MQFLRLCQLCELALLPGRNIMLLPLFRTPVLSEGPPSADSIGYNSVHMAVFKSSQTDLPHRRMQGLLGVLETVLGFLLL